MSQGRPARDWYLYGQLKSETMYKVNLRHGSHREFREDGSLSLGEFYEDGVLVRSSRRRARGDLVVPKSQKAALSEMNRGSVGIDLGAS